MLRIKHFLLLLISLQLLIVQNLFPNTPFSFLSNYDNLLKKYVLKGEIDSIDLNFVSYGEWKKDPFHQKAMQSLLSSNPDELSSKAEKLVYWINAYNLLTIDLILSKEEEESIRNLGAWFRQPWSIYKWEIKEKKYTLDYIENKILRKLEEPRIHMAIVCASVSCPNLRSEAFTVEKLEEQLTDQVLDFLKNQKKGLKKQEDSIAISMIFKWFLEDFGGESGTLLFLKKYHPTLSLNTQKVSYLEYNWKLNGHWKKNEL
jgi:hypothetical protein